MQKLYKIAFSDLRFIPREKLKGWVPNVRGVMTGEFRTPRKGEWYLSGATPEVWYAPSDFAEGFKFRICRLVETETREVIVREVQ